MQIKDLLEKYIQPATDIKQPKTERAELMQKFITRMNADRVCSKRKPLSAGVYAIKMAQAGIKTTPSLRDFYKECERAKNFSAYWWWKIKQPK